MAASIAVIARLNEIRQGSGKALWGAVALEASAGCRGAMGTSWARRSQGRGTLYGDVI